MPAVESFRLGDYGFNLVATVEEDGDVVDVSTATNIVYYLKTPKGNIIQKSGSLLNDGTDGKFKYTGEQGLLSVKDRSLVGDWSYEVKFTLGTWTGTTTSAKFRVDDVIRRT